MEINPIIKEVTTDCNLRCKYCFYSKQDRRKELTSIKVLESIVREICKCNPENGEVMFYWHGGEPLLAGITFYKKALDVQRYFKKPGQKIRNGIVTNGTLVNNEWAVFFKKNSIGAVISLDGPQEYHDRYRTYPDGRGSFNQVMKGVEIFREEEVNFRILSVVTNQAAENPKVIFNFFMRHQLTEINFIPSIGIETGHGISFEDSVRPSLYIDFLMNIFELWLKENNPDTRILPLESIVRAFLKLPQEDCRFTRECERNFVIDYNGDVLACSTHGYGDFFKFGNIKMGFTQMLNSRIYQKYKEYLQRIKKRCSKCQWYQICHGGCPRDHYLGDEQNIFCQDFQRLFQYIQKTLRDYKLISGRMV